MIREVMRMFPRFLMCAAQIKQFIGKSMTAALRKQLGLLQFPGSWTMLVRGEEKRG
jgi:hypothetical protein